MDKVTAATLALRYSLPGNSYRITINLAHDFKECDFKYLRDEVTRRLKKHGIKYFWVAFEVSSSGRLHCHCAANIPDSTEIPALTQTLQARFGNSDEIKHSLRGNNRIVEIDPIVYAPRQRKGPEYWASYAMGDIEFTKALTGWPTVHFISRGLVEPAKAVYDWMREPDINSFPFNPDAAHDMNPESEQLQRDTAPLSVDAQNIDAPEPADSIDDIKQVLADILCPTSPPATNNNELASLDRFIAEISPP